MTYVIAISIAGEKSRVKDASERESAKASRPVESDVNSSRRDLERANRSLRKHLFLRTESAESCVRARVRVEIYFSVAKGFE